HKFFIYWFPIIIYCVLIFIQSSYPSIKHTPELPYFDKVAHCVAYALLGALFLRAFKTSQIKNNVKLMWILSVILSSLYGISDEIHQYFVPYRYAELMDVLADTLGSIMGVYIYQAIAGKISTG
ncbi:MAG: VanZ family protein, partial [Deltaproteobacteria bacterium]|nr:VanZ family protein [Deltaproteobacteria bacterium]